MFVASDTPFDSPRIKSGVVMELNRRSAEAETRPTLSEPLLKALIAVAQQSFGRLLPPLAPDRTSVLQYGGSMVSGDDVDLMVLRADPLLAGQVLAAAASDRLDPPVDLPEAVERMGAEGAWSIIQASASSAPELAPIFAEPAERLAAHSVAVAGLARRLAREEGLDEEVAYVAGLLHDVGRALMLQCVERLSRLPEVASVLAVAGVELFIDHPMADLVGREMVRAWGLPGTLRDAVGIASSSPRPVGGSYAALVARAEKMLDGGINQHELGSAGEPATDEAFDSLNNCPAVA